MVAVHQAPAPGCPACRPAAARVKLVATRAMHLAALRHRPLANPMRFPAPKREHVSPTTTRPVRRYALHLERPTGLPPPPSFAVGGSPAHRTRSHRSQCGPEATARRTSLRQRPGGGAAPRDTAVPRGQGCSRLRGRRPFRALHVGEHPAPVVHLNIPPTRAARVASRRVPAPARRAQRAAPRATGRQVGRQAAPPRVRRSAWARTSRAS